MNKYLEKIAGVDRFARNWKKSSVPSMVGLGMSAAGLSLGTANYANSLENKRDNKQRSQLESASLNELKGISETLKKKHNVTVNLKLQQDPEKQASFRMAAKDALRYAKAHPLPAIGAVGGAIEGASSTTRKKNENIVMTGLRGVKNTVVGGVAGAAVGSVVETLHNKYIRK